MATGCFTDVSECVNAVPGKKDDRAWTDVRPSLPDEETISTFDNDKDLIIASVDVRRWSASWRHHAKNERHRSRCIRSGQLENAFTSERIYPLAFIGVKDEWGRPRSRARVCFSHLRSRIEN